MRALYNDLRHVFFVAIGLAGDVGDQLAMAQSCVEDEFGSVMDDSVIITKMSEIDTGAGYACMVPTSVGSISTLRTMFSMRQTFSCGARY